MLPAPAVPLMRQPATRTLSTFNAPAGYPHLLINKAQPAPMTRTLLLRRSRHLLPHPVIKAKWVIMAVPALLNGSLWLTLSGSLWPLFSENQGGTAIING